MAKEGSTVSGLMDSFATAISLALQYGVPLKVLADKLSHTRFEPSGWTNNPEIGYAKSVMDYIFRWLPSSSCRGMRNRARVRASSSLMVWIQPRRASWHRSSLRQPARAL